MLNLCWQEQGHILKIHIWNIAALVLTIITTREKWQNEKFPLALSAATMSRFRLDYSQHLPTE